MFSSFLNMFLNDISSLILDVYNTFLAQNSSIILYFVRTSPHNNSQGLSPSGFLTPY